MIQIIIPVSDRGQITIPKKFRDSFKAKHVICERNNGFIVLKPVKTREEFFRELEEAEKDWEKHGGKTLGQIAKEHNLKLE